jgi:uncharacterized membrane protein YhaH (DUF805 family)
MERLRGIAPNEWRTMNTELHEQTQNKPTADKAVPMSLAQLYFSFDGRIGLATYWLKGALPIIVLMTFISLIDVEYFGYGPYSGVLTLVARVLILWPVLAITVKRWHDRNKSG